MYRKGEFVELALMVAVQILEADRSPEVITPALVLKKLNMGRSVWVNMILENDIEEVTSARHLDEYAKEYPYDRLSMAALSNWVYEMDRRNPAIERFCNADERNVAVFKKIITANVGPYRYQTYVHAVALHAFPFVRDCRMRGQDPVEQIFLMAIGARLMQGHYDTAMNHAYNYRQFRRALYFGPGEVRTRFQLPHLEDYLPLLGVLIQHYMSYTGIPGLLSWETHRAQTQW